MTARPQDCADLSIESACDEPEKCAVHNTPDDKEKYQTGAGAYEIWNSITALHRVSDMLAVVIPWILPLD